MYLIGAFHGNIHFAVAISETPIRIPGCVHCLRCTYLRWDEEISRTFFSNHYSILLVLCWWPFLYLEKILETQVILLMKYFLIVSRIACTFLQMPSVLVYNQLAPLILILTPLEVISLNLEFLGVVSTAPKLSISQLETLELVKEESCRV